MLLRRCNKLNNRNLVAFGQLTFVFGIAGIMSARIWSSELPDFFEGFIMGLSGTSIGVSLVLNLLYLRRRRLG